MLVVQGGIVKLIFVIRYCRNSKKSDFIVVIFVTFITKFNLLLYLILRLLNGHIEDK